MVFPSLKDLGDIRGKRVLVRVDVNVPIESGEIREHFRIKKIIPTISRLYEGGAVVILLGHHSNEEQSLEPIAYYLNRFFKTVFVKDIFNENSYREHGAVFLCENLRFFKEEKKNDITFAKRLASLGDVYVNEAFSASHRSHASIVGIPKFLPSYAGLLFEEEVGRLEEAFHPPHPFLFILGGVKAETKLPLAEKFLGIADRIFIGGALVNNLFKRRGFEVGVSIVDDAAQWSSALLENKKIMTPSDVIVKMSDGFSRVASPEKVFPEEKILDAGEKTVSTLKEEIKKAALVIWNGPLGDYEHGFEKSTVDLMGAFAETNAEVIVGGGDTIAAIFQYGKEEYFDFLSTGGGAMLQFLSSRTLPGIEALTNAE